jgi:hypothetical protein
MLVKIFNQNSQTEAVKLVKLKQVFHLKQIARLKQITRFKQIVILLFLLFLSACGHSSKAPVTDKNNYRTTNDVYICANPKAYKNKSIGSGECVAFVQACSGAPLTRNWRAGASVVNNPNIQKGTAIATFKNNKYPNKSGYHAAIYSHQTTDAIYVWDQWTNKWGRDQAVHLRPIFKRKNKNASNDAFQYSVITN